MGNEIKTLSAAQGGISPLMGRIERMVAEMCPEGVKIAFVSDFVDLKAGKAIKAEELSPTKDEMHSYPCFGGNGIRGYISKHSHSNSYPIIGRQGALCGCVNWAEGPFYATEHAVVCTPKANSSARFLYYLFEEANLNQYKSQGAQPGLAVSTLNDLKFPLPPLPIQEAIADILDKFDRLSAELQAELQARKQQYEYYKNKLFYNSSNWISGKISEFCTLEKGKTPIQKAVPGEYDLVVTAKERRTNNEYQFDKASAIVPLVSSRGHGVAAINEIYYQEGKFAVGNILCCIAPKDDSVLSAKYLCYYLNHTKDRLIVPLMKGGANVSVTVSALSTIKIKFPSLSEQARIVSILDKFEALVNDLSQGLPAEIAAVKEQYEYYRNKLLTFDKMP